MAQKKWEPKEEEKEKRSENKPRRKKHGWAAKERKIRISCSAKSRVCFLPVQLFLPHPSLFALFLFLSEAWARKRGRKGEKDLDGIVPSAVVGGGVEKFYKCSCGAPLSSSQWRNNNKNDKKSKWRKTAKSRVRQWEKKTGRLISFAWFIRRIEFSDEHFKWYSNDSPSLRK